MGSAVAARRSNQLPSGGRPISVDQWERYRMGWFDSRGSQNGKVKIRGRQRSS